ncbi:MAG: hypothetical protein HYY37_00790 [Candidatus Aenigmarchaeota archaeon]|nr:hypothetical protein [Candidatus Aenigmarchaeota archaeon]
MKVAATVLFLLSLASYAFAHGEAVHETETESFFHMYPQLDVALYGTAALVILGMFVVYFGKKFTKFEKKAAFAVMVVTSLAVTGYLIMSTVQLNTIAETGGPVHWHADYEVWACGEKLVLEESEGLANKVGSEVLHHHNDDRIHIEGVLVRKSDASLGAFFGALGGALTGSELSVLMHDGTWKAWKNGDRCPDGTAGTVQVFVYRVANPASKPWMYAQEKLANADAYVISPFGQVPQGDCIIVEFGEAKELTEHLCASYAIAVQKGELYGS